MSNRQLPPLDLTTGRGRLEHLARIMDDVHARELPFDLATWWDYDIPGAAHDCGTVACAVGWGCRDALLQAQGLGVSEPDPTFMGYEGFYAVQLFFGLSFDAAINLFALHRYPLRFPHATAADVSARIREHLAADALLADAAVERVS